MDYIELFFSTLLSRVRGHDEARFVRGPAFAAHPAASMAISSPDGGPSGAAMHLDHTQEGQDRFPELQWDPVPGAQEYVVVVEDVDAPLPVPIAHGILYGLPSHVTRITDADVHPVEGTRRKPVGSGLKGGPEWRFAPNVRGAVYAGPRALKGHGEHKYYFQVVALKEPLDRNNFGQSTKKAELAKAIEGKVLAWGEWIGVSERKWK